MASSKVNDVIKNIFTKKLSAWDRLKLARMAERPKALEYINYIFTDFLELHGDRKFADDAAIVSGIAFINDIPVTIIAEQKGATTKENLKRNFGMPNPEGYRKALRLMKQAEKFKRPVICFVDTPGAFCGVGAEERGQGEAIAENLMEMSMLKTPVVSIVIGEGGSGGALALAVSDEVWMLQNSFYSVLSPESFASILWRDSSRASEAAEVMKSNAENLKEFAIIDKVISEPDGGAQKDFKMVAGNMKKELYKKIIELKKKPIDELVEKRLAKFRCIGKYKESSDS